jgi:hypothetical protein
MNLAIFILALILKGSSAFMVPSTRTTSLSSSISSVSSSTTTLFYFPEDHTNILLCTGNVISTGDAEWRQFVPLVAACTVILDIVLGQPLLKIVTAPMRRASGLDEDTNAIENDEKPKFIRNEKERIDTNSFAQAAIDRARNSMELRRFLEENKTDEQRYEEKRKEIEKQMENLESRLSSLNLKTKE